MHLIEEEGVVERAAALHRFYAAFLPQLSGIAGVRAVRWLGGIGVVELQGAGYHDAQRSQRVRAECLRHGVLIRPLGPVIYTLPPLGSELADVGRAWDVIATALQHE
jgi:adenosylmethionine-8-amino-7-oxononanoate aminotransferase